MRKPLLSCLLLVVAVRSHATHLVGPNGLSQIRDAIAVATSGDVIVVVPTNVIVPPGQVTHLIGLDFNASLVATFGVFYHALRIDGGQVTLDRCEVRSRDMVALTV